MAKRRLTIDRSLSLQSSSDLVISNYVIQLVARELRHTRDRCFATVGKWESVKAHLSKLYFNHSPTALKLSHLTLSSGSVISSITLALMPNFSSCVRFSGASFTNQPTSLHAIARTCLSSSQPLAKIVANFFGN